MLTTRRCQRRAGGAPYSSLGARASVRSSSCESSGSCTYSFLLTSLCMRTVAIGMASCFTCFPVRNLATPRYQAQQYHHLSLAHKLGN